jgi:hypothetical protein
METFITSLPNTLLGWVGVVLAIFLSALLTFRTYKTGVDRADERLIKILQGTVAELEKKVALLENEQELLINKVNELQRTNETLASVLQGRDEGTLRFQRDVMEAIRHRNDTHDLVVATNKAIMELVAILTKKNSRAK